MNIRVVSDGSVAGTKVLDADTGEKVDRVLSVEFRAYGDEPLAVCTLRVFCEVEIKADADVLNVGAEP